MMPVSNDELLSHIPNLRAKLEKKGITDAFLIGKLKDELGAFFQKTTYDKEAGKWKYSLKMIDWATRQKARIDAHKLKGDYPAEEFQVDTTLEIIIKDAD